MEDHFLPSQVPPICKLPNLVLVGFLGFGGLQATPTNILLLFCFCCFFVRFSSCLLVHRVTLGGAPMTMPLTGEADYKPGPTSCKAIGVPLRASLAGFVPLFETASFLSN